MSIAKISAQFFPNCVQASSQPGPSSDISQSKSKMSVKAEKTIAKKKKEEEEVAVNPMDDVQPMDSISNVSPN